MKFRQILLMQCGGWIAEVRRGGKKNNCLAIVLGQMRNKEMAVGMEGIRTDIQRARKNCEVKWIRYSNLTHRLRCRK